jgi:hypothetical protein
MAFPLSPRLFARTDPFRSPDWRWCAACSLHDRIRQRQRRIRKSDPDWLAPLVGLAELVNPSGGRRRRRTRLVTPELVAAHRLYETNSAIRWELEARLLARQSDEEISAASGTPPAVVATFGRFFFDVRNRLAAADCILIKVIGHDPLRGFEETDLRGLWQYFAFMAGPKMLELVMAVTLDRPLPDWVVEEAPDPASIEQLRTSTKLAILATRRFSGDPRKLLTLRVQALELKRNSGTNVAQVLVTVAGLDGCFGLAGLTVAVESPNKATSRPSSDAAGPPERETAAVA